MSEKCRYISGLGRPRPRAAVAHLLNTAREQRLADHPSCR